MSKKKTGAIDEMSNALKTILERLDDLTSLLYAVGGELVDIEERMIEVRDILAESFSKPLTVTLSDETLNKLKSQEQPKPKQAEAPEVTYPKVE